MDKLSRPTAIIGDSTPTPSKSSDKKLEVDVFRKPYPPAPLLTPQREKRKILEEETFVKDLGHIIERDFFPDIKRLRAKERYLAALEKNDYVTLRQLYAEYKIHRGPSPSPSILNGRDTPSSSFETPIQPRGQETPKTSNSNKDDPSNSSTIDDDEFDRKSLSSATSSNQKKVRDLRLDQYLALNTSEDNVSFEKIMDETKKKERTKPHQAWLYEQQALTHSSTDGKLPHQLSIPSIKEQAETNNPDSSEFWPYTVKNAVMYYPEGAPLTAEEKIEQAKHVREINYEKTRLEIDPFATATNTTNGVQTTFQANSNKQPHVDIDGSEIKPTESPQVGGYKYLVTPSPMPGAHGDESPMMTWGEIEGTPFCLDAGGDTPRLATSGPSFKINATPLRERLALELVEKNAAQHRQKKIEAMKTINRNFASTTSNKMNKDQLVSSMSPAAQRLLSTRLGIQRSQSTNSQRNNPLTPSPVARIGAGTLAVGNRTPKTPLNLGIIKSSPRTPNTTDSLTDNLLNLKR